MPGRSQKSKIGLEDVCLHPNPKIIKNVFLTFIFLQSLADRKKVGPIFLKGLLVFPFEEKFDLRVKFEIAQILVLHDLEILVIVDEIDDPHLGLRFLSLKDFGSFLYVQLHDRVSFWVHFWVHGSPILPGYEAIVAK